MPVSIEKNDAKELSIFRLEGDVTLNELKTVIDTYRHGGPTKFEIYDLSHWAGKPFSAYEVEDISRFIKTGAGKYRSEGKTAIVTSEDIHYGNARVFIAITEIDLPYKINVFRSLREAYFWLDLKL